MYWVVDCSRSYPAASVTHSGLGQRTTRPTAKKCPTLIGFQPLLIAVQQQLPPYQPLAPPTQPKPLLTSSLAPPTPPASPPVSPSSPSTPTFQSTNLLRRLSRRLSSNRADHARRISAEASLDGRSKRTSASPSPMGGLRGEGRRRLDSSGEEEEVTQSIEFQLATPPPSAPPSPSPQPPDVSLLRTVSMSTPSPSPSPGRVAAGRVARSRSVSVRGSLASGLTSGQLTPPENAWDRDWETIGRGRGTGQGRVRGEGGLWWDAEMGICWDGNEIRE